jgi:hypothetical protein
MSLTLHGAVPTDTVPKNNDENPQKEINLK